MDYPRSLLILSATQLRHPHVKMSLSNKRTWIVNILSPPHHRLTLPFRWHRGLPWSAEGRYCVGVGWAGATAGVAFEMTDRYPQSTVLGVAVAAVAAVQVIRQVQPTWSQRQHQNQQSRLPPLQQPFLPLLLQEEVLERRTLPMSHRLIDRAPTRFATR